MNELSNWKSLRRDPIFCETVAKIIKGHRERGSLKDGKFHGKYTQELLHHDLQKKGAGVSLTTLRRCEQGRLELVGLDHVHRILGGLGWNFDITNRKITGDEVFHFQVPADQKVLSALETEVSSSIEAEISALPAFAPTLYDAGSFGWMRDNALNKFKIRTLKQQGLLEIDPSIRADLRFSGTNVVVADEGRGKSTLLRTIGIDMARSLLDQSSRIVPVFGSALNCEPAFERVDSLLKETPASPICLLIDGLDEVDSIDQRVLLKRLFSTISGKHCFLISCRRNVFERLIVEDTNLYSRVSEIFEIQEWSYQSDVVNYVKDVSCRIGDPALTDRFIELAKKIPDYQTVMTKPFFIQVAIYALKAGSSRNQFGGGRITIYDLFSFFYDTWLHTELTRRPSVTRAALELMKYEVSTVHGNIAHSLLKNFGHSLKIADIAVGTKGADIFNENATLSILNVRNDGSTSIKVIEGFVDDSLGSFLSARAYIRAFQESDAHVYEILRTEATNSVNVFVRAWLSNVDLKVRVSVVGCLERVFEEASAANDFLVSEQSVYFLGRTETLVEPTVLERVFYDDDIDFHIRRSAALSAILFANKKLELDFYAEIHSDEKKAAINRSIQLQYFGDVGHRLFSFSDDTGIAWDKTRKATFRRLSEIDTRAQRLRLWDIETIRSFLFCRISSKLTPQEEITLKNLSYVGKTMGKRNSLISSIVADILKTIEIQTPL